MELCSIAPANIWWRSGCSRCFSRRFYRGLPSVEKPQPKTLQPRISVVSDTSPISNLAIAIVGRIEFLHRRYETVWIPSAVAEELAALSHPVGRQRAQAALADGWLFVEKLTDMSTLQFPFPLDAGEMAAIALARQIRADVLLIDEKLGREAARQMGLTVAGALGESVHAKIAGWIPNVRDEIHRLRVEAGFFLDAGVERFILSQAGE
jgi:uncharacterized protein